MFTLFEANAHCDIPCGIYDPIVAQIAALSVVRMVDLIDELEATKANLSSVEFHNAVTRYIAVKESEASKCKEEICIIWGDFIKPSHIQKYPQIHTTAHQIMALASAAKQHVSRQKAMALLQEVNAFAEIFWKIKGVQTKVAKAPYAPHESLIYPIV